MINHFPPKNPLLPHFRKHFQSTLCCEFCSNKGQTIFHFTREWRGPSPLLNARAMQLRKNVATAVRNSVSDLTGLGFEPKSLAPRTVFLITTPTGWFLFKYINANLHCKIGATATSNLSSECAKVIFPLLDGKRTAAKCHFYFNHEVFRLYFWVLLLRHT